MSNSSELANYQDILADQPYEVVKCRGVEYCILGTAHVSRASAEIVEKAIAKLAFDHVAIELCQTRYAAMTDPEKWRKVDLFSIIRQGKAGMVAANLLLSGYQRRVAEQFGIEPGAEMRSAITAAKEHHAHLSLVDREISVTMKKVYRSIGWLDRFSLIAGGLGSLFGGEDITEEEIEKLKQGDLLENTFGEFARQTPALYQALIDDRDQFMANRLLQTGEAGQKVFAVVGAGHLKGIVEYLKSCSADDAEAEIQRLNTIPPKRNLWKFVPWLIVAIILTGFGFGFANSPQLGWELIVTWVVINGGLSALGALIAGGHPFSVIGAFVAAPLTSLNPTVGAGMVVGSIEAWVRKPRVGDFESLRDDTSHFSGWWRNRVSRTLLVLILSNLGSFAATYIAGFQIFSKLAS